MSFWLFLLMVSLIFYVPAAIFASFSAGTRFAGSMVTALLMTFGADALVGLAWLVTKGILA